MKKTSIIICLTLLIFICFGFGSASASILDWKTYETDNFVVFYPQDYEWQAEEVLYYLEKNLPQVKKITGNKDDSKTYIVVQDLGLRSNGITTHVHNRIDVFTSQESSTSLETGNYKNCYRATNIHELTHMLQTTNYSGGSDIFVNLLGQYYSPNFIFVPRWLAEGVAIYSESQLNDYTGRLNDNYYQAIIRAKAKAGKQPTLMEITAADQCNDYPEDLRYVYGAEFYQYLVNKYGEGKCTQLFQEVGTGKSLDEAAKQVVGKSMPELFADWKAVQKKTSKVWQIDGEQVAASKQGVISSLTADKGKLYYFKSRELNSFPSGDSTINQLVEYDPIEGQEKVLQENIASNYSSIQVVGNKLYYSVKTTAQGFANFSSYGEGDIGILYSYDLKTGESKRVISGEIKNFTVLNSGAIIYTKQNKEQFGSEIWKYQAGSKKKLGTVSQLISELKTVQDKVLAVSKERVGSFGISYLDLDEVILTPLIDSKYHERAVNTAGNKLYYTANYTGHQSIYEYNLTTGKLAKLTQGGYAFNGVICCDKVYFIAPSDEGIELYGKQMEAKKYKLPPQEKDIEKIKKPNLAKLDIELKESAAVQKNLGALFPPDLRFLPYPFLFRSQDAVGANTYAIHYPGRISWRTKLFKPFRVAISNNPGKNGRESILDVSYPIYMSSIKGLNEISLNYSTNFNNSFPGLKAVYSYPRQDIEFNLEGDVKKQGINSEVVYKYKFKNSRLKIAGSRFNNFDKQDNLRGVGLEFDNGDNGYQLSTEYSHKLLEIRKGFWSARLFMSDIYGNAFVDYAYNLNSKADKTAYGYEFLLETAWWKRRPFNIKLGGSYCEGELNPVYGVQFTF